MIKSNRKLDNIMLYGCIVWPDWGGGGQGAGKYELLSNVILPSPNFGNAMRQFHNIECI